MLTLAAALLALIPLTLLQKLASTQVFHPELLPIAVYALGVLALGLIDDTLARESSDGGERLPQRGWRGHGAACCAASSRRVRSRPPARSAWRCLR